MEKSFKQNVGKKMQKQRMEQGLIYSPTDPALLKEQWICQELLYDFNQTRPSELAKREGLLKKMFASLGEGCYIEPPLRASWGGKNVYMGEYVYANFNLTLVDDGNIYIGDRVMIGPNVTLATANHPILPELRETQMQYNREIHIGRNVWIGSKVVVVPGVSIGENSVIGAGSIVTKDIPANVIAYGNPCRVIREISEYDREYYYKDQKIDWDQLQ